jgi:hypothetical protein
MEIKSKEWTVWVDKIQITYNKAKIEDLPNIKGKLAMYQVLAIIRKVDQT